jgi:hypothetical protein
MTYKIEITITDGHLEIKGNEGIKALEAFHAKERLIPALNSFIKRLDSIEDQEKKPWYKKII